MFALCVSGIWSHSFPKCSAVWMRQLKRRRQGQQQECQRAFCRLAVIDSPVFVAWLVENGTSVSNKMYSREGSSKISQNAQVLEFVLRCTGCRKDINWRSVLWQLERLRENQFQARLWSVSCLMFPPQHHWQLLHAIEISNMSKGPRPQ